MAKIAGASNVDYPHLLFQIVSGKGVSKKIEVDYSVRTESPVTGLLATLDEIAHDEKLLNRFRSVRCQFGRVAYGDLKDMKLRPFWDA